MIPIQQIKAFSLELLNSVKQPKKLLSKLQESAANQINIFPNAYMDLSGISLNSYLELAKAPLKITKPPQFLQTETNNCAGLNVINHEWRSLESRLNSYYQATSSYKELRTVALEANSETAKRIISSASSFGSQAKAIQKELESLQSQLQSVLKEYSSVSIDDHLHKKNLIEKIQQHLESIKKDLQIYNLDIRRFQDLILDLSPQENVISVNFRRK